jgi:hypothetical protein
VTRDPVRAVVFDVGNTLWFVARQPDSAEIERLQARPLEALLARWGMALPCPPEEIVRAVHEMGEEAEHIERARGTLREVSIPFLIRGTLAARGIDISSQ